MTDWNRVQRIVFDADAERVPLYARGGEVVSRTAVRIGDEGTVSLATYFGAFPAAYWSAHTEVTSVRVVGRIEGTAHVRVMSTDPSGAVHVRAEAPASATFSHVVELDDDPAWLWIDLAGDPGTLVDDIAWEVPNVPRLVSLTVAVTTFDRNADCIRLLGRLAASPAALAVIDGIVVVDQGGRRLVAAPEWDGTILGDRLTVVEQRNLGGSGGFSRGMFTGVEAGSTHVLLLDDDVDLEPESLRRLADFAAHVTSPRIVGAHMLSLVQPTRLHSFGERVDRRSMWWGPVDPSLADLDLTLATVDRMPELSRRIDVDFNGWWMCLIPADLIAAQGASLPMFLKWDDAEFGLRASAVGVGTVTLPGAALWHMPWTSKDDGLDWQAYFQFRNRLVAALLHGGPGVLRASFAQDINHILCGQYGSAAVRNLALRDVLSGPGHLDPVLEAGPARAAAVLAAAGQVVVGEADEPPAALEMPPRPPTGAIRAGARFVRVIVHQLRRPRSGGRYVRMGRENGKWWSLGLLDRSLVGTAAASGAFVVRRDRRAAGSALWSAIALRVRLRRAWRRTAAQYRAAAGSSASRAVWDARFAAEPEH